MAVTVEIALVLSFLGISVVFLITEWIPMEATALLVLGALAVSGLLTPGEALSGFSNPAVVTVWAVFILSGALTKTGVANVIGQGVLRVGGRSEILLIIAIMVSAGGMSAFMNNVAVAALMLPVIMDISRQTDHPPSRLLMPLAYGSLLGGLTTMIGTPPNILVSDALAEYGLVPFTLFDYTPAGIMVMIAGILFMLLVGRHLLPKRDTRTATSTGRRLDIKQAYDLEKRLFMLHLSKDSKLVGKSLAEIRLRTLLGLNVVAITRKGQNHLAPPPSERLVGDDVIVVEGQMDRVSEISHWGQLKPITEGVDVAKLFSKEIVFCEARLASPSSLSKKSLNEIGFRKRFGVNVLAITVDDKIKRSDFQDEILEPEMVLLLQGTRDRFDGLKEEKDFSHVKEVDLSRLTEFYKLEERLVTMEVPGDSIFAGKTLATIRLGDALGLQILCIVRQGRVYHMPGPEEALLGGDQLVMEGHLGYLDIIKAMEGLKTVENKTVQKIPELESEDVGFMEVMLSPHTTLTGKTIRQIRFREKYDLTALAIWRAGKAVETSLRDTPLHFGDALLLYGKREKFLLLGQDPDFLVLTKIAQDIPRTEKIWISIGVFATVLLTVVLGWVPIYIAAVIGAACMVITKCLTMQEAYRYIEWKAIFLIAGMLPLGIALDKTGAARFIAEIVVSWVGPLGPTAVMGGIVGLTFLATCFVPTSALVVIMAPIAIKTSTDLGIAPHALMMAVALAASASFMTPVSHPANVLVMGPGGYRFIDYIKIGLPLTLITFIVLLFGVPIFWPF